MEEVSTIGSGLAVKDPVSAMHTDPLYELRLSVPCAFTFSDNLPEWIWSKISQPMKWHSYSRNKYMWLNYYIIFIFILSYILLYSILLYYTTYIYYIILYYIILYYIYYIILYYIILYYIILYYIILYYIILYYSILCYVMLYYIFMWFVLFKDKFLPQVFRNSGWFSSGKIPLPP